MPDASVLLSRKNDAIVRIDLPTVDTAVTARAEGKGLNCVAALNEATT